jgi:hypothetical protein
VNVAARTSGTVARRTTTSSAANPDTYSSARWPSSVVAAVLSLQSSASHVQTAKRKAPEREESDARRHYRRPEHEQGRDDHEGDEGAPGPPGREVAAAREGDERQSESQAKADADPTGVEAGPRHVRSHLSQFGTSLRG